MDLPPGRLSCQTRRMSTATSTPPTDPASADPAQRDALVTGEAVLLDLRPASFATRILSFAIDGAVSLAVLIGGTWSLAMVARAVALDDGYVAAGAVLITAFALLGLPVLSETVSGGRSLGRWALGTRVVRDDGGPLHVRQSVLRAVSALFEIWSVTGMLALAVALVDPRSRRLGDLLAGTFVLQERLRTPAPVRVSVPEHLGAWARGADVGRLPPAVLQEIRTFLARSASLHARSRRDLALDLVQQVVPSVSPPPPPGTDPEEFLRAVLAERSRRDEALLRSRRERELALARQVAELPFSA